MYNPTKQDINSIKEIVNNNSDVFNDDFLKKILIYYNGDINQTVESLLTGLYKDIHIDNNSTINDNDDDDVTEVTSGATKDRTHTSLVMKLLSEFTYTTVNILDDDINTNKDIPKFVIPKNNCNIGLNYFHIYTAILLYNHKLLNNTLKIDSEFVNSTIDNQFDYQMVEIFSMLLKKSIKLESVNTDIDLSKILVSKSSYYTTEEIVNDLYCMHFPKDEYTHTLNNMLNNLFIWDDGRDEDDDDEEEEEELDTNNKLVSVGDIFTIIFDQDEDDDLDVQEGDTQEVNIPIKFYPTIYQSDTLHTIKHTILPKIKSMNDKINELNTTLNMKLKYYQGSPILSFLNTTLKYLSTMEVLDSAQDNDNNKTLKESLEMVKIKLSNKKTLLTNEINSLKEKLSLYDLDSLQLSDELVKEIGNNNASPLTEYTLIGIIVSSNNYFILNSTGNYSNFIVSNNTLNYNNSSISKELLQNVLFPKFIKYSKKEPIMCIYGKNDCLKSTLL